MATRKTASAEQTVDTTVEVQFVEETPTTEEAPTIEETIVTEEVPQGYPSRDFYSGK